MPKWGILGEVLRICTSIEPNAPGQPIPKYLGRTKSMLTKTLTIKNVDLNTVAALRSIRRDERRQLAAILEDCVRTYEEAYYQEEEEFAAQ